MRYAASRSCLARSLRLSAAAAVVGGLVLSLAPEARAASIIKNPGDHPDYSVELEPHLLLQHSDRYGGGEGWGPGVRVNIPIVDNGFVKTINNNVAIGFGLDISFGDNDCGWYWNRYDRRFWNDSRLHDNCSSTEFWFPVAMQWNFWLTDVISVFGEPGLAIVHKRWSWEWWCSGRVGDPVCEYDDSHTYLRPVFFGGARFMFSDNVGATVRLGWPYVSGGINILF